MTDTLRPKFHASDVFNVCGGYDMASYFIRFVANLDPNGFGDLA
jgi:acetylcholinesterase